MMITVWAGIIRPVRKLYSTSQDTVRLWYTCRRTVLVGEAIAITAIATIRAVMIAAEVEGRCLAAAIDGGFNEDIN